MKEQLTINTEGAPKKQYFGWIDGAHKILISENCPSLLEKLENLNVGDQLSLNKNEKSFLIDCIEQGVPEISNLISGIASKIWGVNSVHWKDNGAWNQENLAAAFWWNFKNPSELIDFYLNTTKEEAQVACQSFFGGNKFGPETKFI